MGKTFFMEWMFVVDVVGSVVVEITDDILDSDDVLIISSSTITVVVAGFLVAVIVAMS